MTLDDYLRKLDAAYDEAEKMVLAPAHGPGYHTRIVDGTPVHETRKAMDYAIALLQSGEKDRVERACDIIDKMCWLQETDPTDSHYGIWGWFLEEPAKQMNPADWNWADFIGSRLAQALRLHASQLRPATASAARVALEHAAWSIFRRNVTVSYTNIAIMGAVVCAAAGELLSMPLLVEYGRVRLRGVIALLEATGGLNEYNSPTYTRVALEEAERALLLVKDGVIRECAERLRVVAWRTIAEHFHPATGQIAGPCSRAYSDWVSPALHRYLAEQTGVAIALRRESKGEDGYDLVTPLPCPAEVVERFRGLPELPHQIVCRFGTNVRGDTVGTTWFDDEACLGTVNRDHTWNQRRVLLGYWRTERDPAVCLRLRVLKDGRDFAPCYAYQSQRANRVLGAFSLAYGAGDFHPNFDRADAFAMKDLRLRFSLAGEGATVREMGDGRFALVAGGRRAVIHTPGECEIGGRRVEWRTSKGPAGEACVDAVLYEGPGDTLDGRSTRLTLGFGLELLREGEAGLTERPTVAEAGDERAWRWGDLGVSCPAAPVPFTW